MKTGYKLVYKLLTEFFLRTVGARGAVLPPSISTYSFLNRKGFNVDYGIVDSRYDFIYLRTTTLTSKTISKYLTKVEKHGIIIVRTRNFDFQDVAKYISNSNYAILTSVYVLNENEVLVKFYMEGTKDEEKFRRGI